MSSEDNANNGLVVRHETPFRDRFASSGAIIKLVAAWIVLGLVCGVGMVFVARPFAMLFGPLGAFIAMFCVSMAMGVAGIMALEGGSKKLRKKRRKLMELQKRLTQESTKDLCADLQTLVQGYLELKEYQLADFYSNKLLQQSAFPPDERATKLNESMYSTKCWVSTPEYHKSGYYWLLSLYESHGSLVITPDRMEYKSKRITFEVDLADIREVTIEHHPRWLKPIVLKYMVVKFHANGTEQTIYVTPGTAETDTVFEVNRLIDQWHELIRVARERRTAVRTIEKMKAQIPGVGSEQKV
jgi:hypothetical protein